jgi:ATP-dependent Zn protease
MLRGLFSSGESVGKDGSGKAGVSKRATNANRITFDDVAGIDSARLELGATFLFV